MPRNAGQRHRNAAGAISRELAKRLPRNTTKDRIIDASAIESASGERLTGAGLQRDRDVLPAARERRDDGVLRWVVRLERDVSISVETLALFVRFWLTTNPPLPEPARAAAQAQAGERYDAFIAALGRRLAKGPALRQEVSEDVYQ